MSKKVYGYVIINSDNGEQWGTAYSSKQGATLSYNTYFNSHWRQDRHKFADQTLWVRKELVIAE
jgi:hypothetical protein